MPLKGGCCGGMCQHFAYAAIERCSLEQLGRPAVQINVIFVFFFSGIIVGMCAKQGAGPGSIIENWMAIIGNILAQSVTEAANRS